MNTEEEVYYQEADTVSVSKKVVIDSGTESILTKAGRAFFYAFLFLFPLWFFPNTIAPVEINKNYFAGIMLIVSLLLTLGGILQDGRMRFVRSKFFLGYISFLLVSVVASLFSQSPIVSIWGIGTETMTLTNLIIAAVALFLGPLILKDSRQLRTAFFFFVLSPLVLTVFFFIQSVFGIDIFWWDFTKERGFSPFGSWNSLAMFMGVGAVMFISFIGSRSSLFLKLSGIWFLFLLAGVVFTNFSIVWIGFGVVALLFVALGLTLRQQKTQMFALSLFLLMISVLFVLLGGRLGTYFASFGRPAEIGPLFKDSLNITERTLSDSPLIGTGPNSFASAWDKYKNPEINNSSFWQVRFNSGSSALLSIALETGLVGLIVFLCMMAIFLWHGVRTMSIVTGEEAPYARALFAAGLFLLVMWSLYSISFGLLLITFVLIGMFYVALREEDLIESYDVDLFQSKERGFVFSLIIIFLLVGGIAGVYYQTTRYMGQVAFAKGIEIFNKDQAANGAQIEIRKAADLDPWQDRFFRTFAQLDLVKLQRILTDKSTEGEARTQQFLDTFASAKAAAEGAIRINKNEPANYRSLGQVYEAAIPVDPDNALPFAVENYEKAKELSPVDPSIYVDIARAYLTYADVKLLRGGGTTSQKIAADARSKAAGFLEEATKLKSDYGQAHFTLAQIYVLQNKLDEAIGRAEATARLAPNDSGVLFQLGLLYYRKENLAGAETAFKKAISSVPNFSNARYFLGLVYDKQNKPQEALAEFKKVAELNPENQEVQRIIKALEEGKKASEVLAQPAPEDRKETPLKDGKTDNTKKDSAIDER